MDRLRAPGTVAGEARSPEASVLQCQPFGQEGGRRRRVACLWTFLMPLVSRAPEGTASGHTAWAAVLTIPRGQEVVVGAEGQGAYADFRVCSVSSGFQSLQGHRPGGDLVWNVTSPPLSQRTHTRDTVGWDPARAGGTASDPVRSVQTWGCAHPGPLTLRHVFLQLTALKALGQSVTKTRAGGRLW